MVSGSLLPKKGYPMDIRSWRPVSLLCMDSKILSKAVALRLGDVKLSIIRSDQTYCVPNRFISDNITLIKYVWNSPVHCPHKLVIY